MVRSIFRLGLMGILVLSMFGCVSWMSSKDGNSAAPNGQEAASAEAQAGTEVGGKEAAGTVVSSSGANVPKKVVQDLNTTAKKLVNSAAKTVTPSVNSKAVTRNGNEYVASYVHVDTTNIKTEARPASGKKDTYIGVIKYEEHHYQCRGATKAAALKAPCKKVRTRRMSELIRYDNKKWTY